MSDSSTARSSRNGFTDYLRDYEVVIDVPAALPPEVPIGDTTGSYIEGRYRPYR